MCRWVLSWITLVRPFPLHSQPPCLLPSTRRRKQSPPPTQTPQTARDLFQRTLLELVELLDLPYETVRHILAEVAAKVAPPPRTVGGWVLLLASSFMFKVVGRQQSPSSMQMLRFLHKACSDCKQAWLLAVAFMQGANLLRAATAAMVWQLAPSNLCCATSRLAGG